MMNPPPHVVRHRSVLAGVSFEVSCWLFSSSLCCSFLLHRDEATGRHSKVENVCEVSSGFRAVRFSCMLGEFGLVSLVGWFLCVPPTSQSARVYAMNEVCIWMVWIGACGYMRS
ncbi:uncharacterized protein LOC134185651 [Corticium candelabrum]|uniref:uncharacterized protein LOC134185651 n=1 Tax=Corticium candelabrum TaxID=121492 RepID=UPI002E2731F6|nr:uncharacterized protein LOC134185651 [Corticium candelabrum]XP_062509475.1 uncharacterized protein LOC134185651 [Corticium candelabrum]